MELEDDMEVPLAQLVEQEEDTNEEEILDLCSESSDEEFEMLEVDRQLTYDAMKMEAEAFPRSEQNFGSHLVNFLLLARLPKAMTKQKMDRTLHYQSKTLPQPNELPRNHKTVLKLLGVCNYVCIPAV